ncbi:sugar ABC transporter permease [Actinobacteria bacterium YIM 96077]|uniref:Arabinose transporter permease n=1 Tax=Phytoactinopolyspora halophila TaxID=1981511 RepID=A0A329QG91_9ACTN|nr:sugar ABC transporter permease [Phytoactinopolyspora halophila]AYY14074.1 sugar ABC transporter permease [Actinobacteria bacterium YIM 96077]RAW10981.1 arabinose transporter permease [Phytoactinopolyspora halophila]
MSIATTTRAARSGARKPKPPFFHRPPVVAAVFLLPFLALFVVFRVYAVGYAVVLSFQDIEGIGVSEWAGLDNYRRLLTDSTFLTALQNTALYTVGTLLILIPLPFVLAAVLRSKLVARQAMFRSAFFLPVLTSLVVVGVVFSLLLATNGLLNSFLGLFGVPEQGWLETRHLAVPAMIIMATWRWTGINIIYFTTGLSNIPNELYESASVDGAGPVRKFWHLSVPLSKPIILFVTVLTLFGGFQLFVEPLILWGTGGGPGQGGLSIVVHLYRTAFTSFQLGYASAIGVVLALIIMALSIVVLKLFGFFKKD